MNEMISRRKEDDNCWLGSLPASSSVDDVRSYLSQSIPVANLLRSQWRNGTISPAVTRDYIHGHDRMNGVWCFRDEHYEYHDDNSTDVDSEPEDEENDHHAPTHQLKHQFIDPFQVCAQLNRLNIARMLINEFGGRIISINPIIDAMVLDHNTILSLYLQNCSIKLIKAAFDLAVTNHWCHCWNSFLEIGFVLKDASVYIPYVYTNFTTGNDNVVKFAEWIHENGLLTQDCVSKWLPMAARYGDLKTMKYIFKVHGVPDVRSNILQNAFAASTDWATSQFLYDCVLHLHSNPFHSKSEFLLRRQFLREYIKQAYNRNDSSKHGYDLNAAIEDYILQHPLFLCTFETSSLDKVAATSMPHSTSSLLLDDIINGSYLHKKYQFLLKCIKALRNFDPSSISFEVQDEESPQQLMWVVDPSYLLNRFDRHEDFSFFGKLQKADSVSAFEAACLAYQKLMSNIRGRFHHPREQCMHNIDVLAACFPQHCSIYEELSSQPETRTVFPGQQQNWLLADDTVQYVSFGITVERNRPDFFSYLLLFYTEYQYFASNTENYVKLINLFALALKKENTQMMRVISQQAILMINFAAVSSFMDRHDSREEESLWYRSIPLNMVKDLLKNGPYNSQVLEFMWNTEEADLQAATKLRKSISTSTSSATAAAEEESTVSKSSAANNSSSSNSKGKNKNSKKQSSYAMTLLHSKLGSSDLSTSSLASRLDCNIFDIEKEFAKYGQYSFPVANSWYIHPRWYKRGFRTSDLDDDQVVSLSLLLSYLVVFMDDPRERVMNDFCKKERAELWQSFLEKCIACQSEKHMWLDQKKKQKQKQYANMLKNQKSKNPQQQNDDASGDIHKISSGSANKKLATRSDEVSKFRIVDARYDVHQYLSPKVLAAVIRNGDMYLINVLHSYGLLYPKYCVPRHLFAPLETMPAVKDRNVWLLMATIAHCQHTLPILELILEEALFYGGAGAALHFLNLHCPENPMVDGVQIARYHGHNHIAEYITAKREEMTLLLTT